MTNYVAYYRVSTQKQGKSGLGLEAQKEIVKRHLGKTDLLITEFTEVESGKRDDRPELRNALEFCKANDATLIIAKLDRLSRNVSFIFALRDSGAKFECCDLPQANTMTIAIFAGLAQQERELISQRTKAALEAKKRQGFKLGSPQNLNPREAAKLSALIRSKQARNKDNIVKAFSIIRAMREGEKATYRKIALELNRVGLFTSWNKNFTATQVYRIYKMGIFAQRPKR